ncbi:hypothetical protein SAMN02745133_02532 [Desulforamulus putei DSM 12395]|uniref:Uncharacterized protein n=1 Tax=Desulforamulus putei DSM 12395 TaxID=1121429 RepID=A0A1M5BAI5_9FIRM|nr:hypothetical protein [Desulforamulus putei]SHF39337.1 hypothetical protein SAMN02745133_02532 [Desulforamulus putei DSM 12395]
MRCQYLGQIKYSGHPIYGFLMAKGLGLMFWSSAGLALLGAVLALIFIKAQKEKAGKEKQAPIFVFKPVLAKKPEIK